MTFKTTDYVNWWSDHFKHYVIFKVDSTKSIYSQTHEQLTWMKEHYPELDPDQSHRFAKDTRPYWEYDYGHTTTFNMDYMILYFKDPKVAAHFKLVWG